MVVERARHTNRLRRGVSAEAVLAAAAIQLAAIKGPDPLSFHYSMPIPKQAMVKDVQRSCVACNARNVRKRTSFECPYCPGKQALCVGDCFGSFHLRRVRVMQPADPEP